MSNTSPSPASPVAFRLPRGALLFVILILALGALILAASSGSNSGVRGNVTYTKWSSSDNAIYLEYPSDWTFSNTTNAASDNSGIAYPEYDWGVPNDTATRVAVYITATSGMDAITGELVTAGKLENVAQPISQPIVVGNIRGLELHQTQLLPASNANQDTDAWIIPLDANHVLVAWIQTPNWQGLQPQWAHITGTLRVDPNIALHSLGIFTATPTSTHTPTPTPTVAGTGVATGAATSAATGTPAATVAAIAGTGAATASANTAATPTLLATAATALATAGQ